MNPKYELIEIGWRYTDILFCQQLYLSADAGNVMINVFLVILNRVPTVYIEV